MRCSAAVALAALGCRDPGPLVDMSLWSRVEAADDPFDDRPDDVRCSSAATYVEATTGTPSLEIDTGLCNYLLLSQPSLREVRADDLVEVWIFHDQLLADAPAEAHAVIRLGSWEAWGLRAPIPSDPEVYIESAEAPETFPEGTPVWLHLHNHGDNTWNLFEVTMSPP
ncbi:MAG: hypothetical protein H6739_14880 [Alphaproteobacteria bacterium]|nr:hypothetical protein [Alphaproteobacteria bacterium]